MARILVADDDHDVRDLITLLLARDGHVVTPAADGVEALSLCQSGVFDLVCTDLDMPGLSGTELTRAIRAGPLDAVPILMITASARACDVAEAQDAGISAMLSKPFRYAQLRVQVIMLLNVDPSADSC